MVTWSCLLLPCQSHWPVYEILHLKYCMSVELWFNLAPHLHRIKEFYCLLKHWKCDFTVTLWALMPPCAWCVCHFVAWFQWSPSSVLWFIVVIADKTTYITIIAYSIEECQAIILVFTACLVWTWSVKSKDQSIYLTLNYKVDRWYHPPTSTPDKTPMCLV